MREKNWKKNLLTCFGAAVLFVAATLGFPVTSVHAESGSVYSCTINRCYSHPVTGEIEDSGGEASYATGQGMVEGAVYASGLMEVTDSGNYYLTIRMSLIDYTSGHSFSVQNVGDSGWSGTGVAVTANGSDSNGTTSDICIQVPSENCIVRVSMYVTPLPEAARQLPTVPWIREVPRKRTEQKVRMRLRRTMRRKLRMMRRPPRQQLHRALQKAAPQEMRMP